MKAIRNLSIRNKIAGIVVLSTILSLLLGFLLVVRDTTRMLEQDMVSTAEIIASVIGSYSAIAVLFDEAEMAQLTWLQRTPMITAAYIFGRTDLEVNDDEILLDDWPDSRQCTTDFSAGQFDELIPDVDESIYRLFDDFTERAGPESSAPPAFGPARVVGANFIAARAPICHAGVMIGVVYVRIDKELLNERIREFVLYMFALTLALVLAAVVIAFILQNVISAPILRLAEATRHIRRQGDYSLRVEKPGNDEIGTLYDGFNLMLEEIEQRQAELERSNRDLDQFAYVASHDLKAPLRAITNLSVWLEEDLGDTLDDEAREQMRLLRSRVRRMNALIEGILQYSRLGRLGTEGERVDVGKLLHELIPMLEIDSRFEIVIGEPMPVLVTRRLRLEQVFANLITNAVKHHDQDKGRIEILARRDGDTWSFTVTDDGPGIAPEHREKVFMMFQTLRAASDSTESTGLGLSLVKKLVEDEGGVVEIADRAAARGAVVRFSWPAQERMSEDRRE
ncbi:MAG: ATP-binding protein [Acidobacteriota bacterium]